MNFRKNKARAVQILPIGLLFILCTNLFAQTINPERSRRIDRIVAVVNEEVITQSEVNRVLATLEVRLRSSYTDPEELAVKVKQAEENIISQMVEEKLILSEAKKLDIKIAQEKIEARIEEAKEDFADEEQFEQALDKQGLTPKDLRTRFRDQEIMKKAVDYFVRSQIKVDPREISQFYQEKKDEFTHPEKALVKNILIKADSPEDERQALEKAKAVLEQLRKGADFEHLAKIHSQGGLSLGYVEKGQLLKEIEETVFSLEPGQFSDVIKTPQGYRIFKVEEKKPQIPLEFAEAQVLIENLLYKKKFNQVFKKWLGQLKEKADISIKE